MKSEGPLGLYRGAIPTILKQAARMPLQVQFMGILVGNDAVKQQNPLYNG